MESIYAANTNLLKDGYLWSQSMQQKYQLSKGNQSMQQVLINLLRKSIYAANINLLKEVDLWSQSMQQKYQFFKGSQSMQQIPIF